MVFFISSLSRSFKVISTRFLFSFMPQALVNSPENLITRIQLREEFARSGFDPVLKVGAFSLHRIVAVELTFRLFFSQRIQHDSNPELATQVAVYFEESEADFADATSAYLVFNGSDLK